MRKQISCFGGLIVKKPFHPVSLIFNPGLTILGYLALFYPLMHCKKNPKFSSLQEHLYGGVLHSLEEKKSTLFF